MKLLFLNTILILLRALLLFTLLPLATSQNYPPIAQPNCEDRCGDIPIPFPFGTNPKCYYTFNFYVTCNRNLIDAPKLFWQETTIEIKSISLLGQMTVMQFISYDCNAGNGTRNNFRPYINLARFFTVNNTANRFTTVGCDSFGLIYGRGVRRRYSTGCIASCSTLNDLEEGSCTGIGCCQLSIPKDAWNVNVTVGRYVLSDGNASQVTRAQNCSFGFIVEATKFKFHPDNITNLIDTKKLPMVVDWAIGNKSSCEEAKKNTSDYACKSDHSECYKPESGYGYRCLCKLGYHGNPYLIDGCQDIDECNPGPGQNKSCIFQCENTLGGFKCICPKGQYGDGKIDGEGCIRRQFNTSKLVAGICMGVIILLLVLGSIYYMYNRRQSERVKQKWFHQNGGQLLLQKLPARERSHDSLKIFTSSELKRATNDFHKDNIVGQGGFGTVYKGVLSDKRTVAIKKSKRVDPDQIEQFVSEVIVVSQINHRNTVKLLGCCLDTEVPHLVYEFINNGTLYSHLHNSTNVHLLNWDRRLRIAADTANVLSYLHSSASIPIIHRDVKSDNILLDHTFTAKVSDFGASRLIPLDQTQISTVVQGTTGYLDPEYLQTHQLTAKSDVYSFGVVLLELITGRIAVRFHGPEKERSLVSYGLYMMKQNSFSLLIDRHIVSDGNREQIMEVARIAQWCLKMSGDDRPDMKVVAMELESLLHGRKQLFGQTEQGNIENQPLLGEGFDGIITNVAGSRTRTSGFDSFVDQVARPLSGGR